MGRNLRISEALGYIQDAQSQLDFAANELRDADIEGHSRETVRQVIEYVEKRANPGDPSGDWWDLLVLLENRKTGEEA